MENININEFTELKNEIQELQKSLKNQNILGTKKILNSDEVCVLTGLSKSTIFKKTSGKQIPHHKAPGSKFLHFDRDEVEKWMLQRHFKTNAELASEVATHMVTKKGKKQTI
jgi:excisionase family DNA binding protein